MVVRFYDQVLLTWADSSQSLLAELSDKAARYPGPHSDKSFLSAAARQMRSLQPSIDRRRAKLPKETMTNPLATMDPDIKQSTGSVGHSDLDLCMRSVSQL